MPCLALFFLRHARRQKADKLVATLQSIAHLRHLSPQLSLFRDGFRFGMKIPRV